MSSTGENVLENRLFKFLASAKYHDLVIECQETEFHVHRVVVCSGSTFFEKMCDSGFKESLEGIVKLNEDEPDIIALVLVYLYTLDFSYLDLTGKVPAISVTRKHKESESSTTEANLGNRISKLGAHLTVLAKVYGCAEKYDVHGLKAECKRRFQLQIKETEPLDSKDFLSSIDVIYDNTPDTDRGLRDLVVYTAQNNLPVLETKAQFKSLIRMIPDFAVDMVTRCAKQDFLWCPTCKKNTTMPASTCTCGWAGLCGARLCAQRGLGSLYCTECKTQGLLQRYSPEDDE